MFFFIGGLSIRRVPLGKGLSPQDCIYCLKTGIPSLVRDDAWLSLFIVPVLCLKKGSEKYVCGSCGNVTTFELSPHEREVLVQARRSIRDDITSSSTTISCPSCKCPIFLLRYPRKNHAEKLRFCPYCGNRLIVDVE